MIDLSKELISHLYIDRGYSDKEIANFMGIHRTQISRLRSTYGISTRQSLWELGETFVKDYLQELGHDVTDMNEIDKTYSYDLLVNGRIKIDVKAAKETSGFYKFILTEKSENGNIESESRLRLSNGRTKKIYRKTCDFIVFVGIREENALPIIVPSQNINDLLQTLSYPISGISKYKPYANAWEQIKK